MRGDAEEEVGENGSRMAVAESPSMPTPQRVVRDRYRRTFTSNDRIDRPRNTYRSSLDDDEYNDKRSSQQQQQQQPRYSEDRRLENLNFSFAQQDDDYMPDMMPPMPHPEELSGSKRQREQSSLGSYDEAIRKRARRSPSPSTGTSYVDIDDVDDEYLRDFGVAPEGNHSTPNASTRSRRSIFGSARRLKTIKPRKSRFIEGSMNNRHSEKPPSDIIGSQTEYDAVSPQLKSAGGPFNESRIRSKPASEEFSVAGLASAVFTFRAVSYFKDTYWNPRKQKFEEMEAKEEQKRRAEEAYQELKKRGMPGTVPPLPPRLQVPQSEYARRKEAARRSREASELMDIDRSRGPSVHSNIRMDEDEEEDDDVDVGRAVTTDQLVPAESYSPKKRHSRRISDDTADTTLVDDYMSSKSPSTRHQSENPEMDHDFSDRYSHRSPSYQPTPSILSKTRTNQTTYTQNTQASSYQTPVRAQTAQATTSTKSTTPSTVKTLKQRASKLFTPRGSAAQKLEEARRERLLKKYSNLEDKLLKARQELEEAGVAPPPLPDTLATSPSQRSLHSSFNGDSSVRSTGSRATSRIASPASPEMNSISGVYGPLTSQQGQRQQERGPRKSGSFSGNNGNGRTASIPPTPTPTQPQAPTQQISHVSVDVTAGRRARQGSVASTRTMEGERMSVDTTREPPTERMSIDTTHDRESMPPPKATLLGMKKKVDSLRSNGSGGSGGNGRGKLNGGSIRLVSS